MSPLVTWSLAALLGWNPTTIRLSTVEICSRLPCQPSPSQHHVHKSTHKHVINILEKQQNVILGQQDQVMHMMSGSWNRERYGQITQKIVLLFCCSASLSSFSCSIGKNNTSTKAELGRKHLFGSHFQVMVHYGREDKAVRAWGGC